MIQIYQKDLNRYSRPLTRIEQTKLYDKIKKGDRNAKNIVINSCLPLVVSIAKKFRCNNKHIDLEDMIQEGNIALMKAVDNWDVGRGSITTVATWCIRNSLVDMINDCRYTIRYPYSLSRRAAEELRKIYNVDSTDVKYIAKITGLNAKRVKKLLSISPRGMRRIRANQRELVSARSPTDGERGNVQELNVELSQESQKPCLGDLIDLIDTTLEGDQKIIFCLWAGVSKKKIGPKEIAKSLDKSEQYVYDNIYSAKRILSRAAKKVKYHA